MNSANDSEWKSCIINLYIIKSSINLLNQSILFRYIHGYMFKSQPYIQMSSQWYKMQINYNHDCDPHRRQDYDDFVSVCYIHKKNEFCLAKSWNQRRKPWSRPSEVSNKEYIRFQTDYCLVTMLLNERLVRKLLFSGQSTYNSVYIHSIKFKTNQTSGINVKYLFG